MPYDTTMNSAQPAFQPGRNPSTAPIQAQAVLNPVRPLMMPGVVPGQGPPGAVSPGAFMPGQMPISNMPMMPQGQGPVEPNMPMLGAFGPNAPQAPMGQNNPIGGGMGNGAFGRFGATGSRASIAPAPTGGSRA